MKKWIIIILAFWCTAAYSQKDNSNLSYEECMSLYNAGKISEAIPSLLVLKEHYEQPGNYNGAMYYGIIYALHYYYMQIGDFSSSRNLLSDAGNLFNKRESEPNNEYIRNLLCCRGQLEVMLKNYGDALNYLNQAQVYFEEKNDYSESYLVAMMNMALSYQSNGDLLSAKIYMDEAIDQFENLHGSVYDIKDESQFIILSNYGYLYNAIGHDKEAEKCFLTIINNCKKTAFSNDTYMLACNNLSTMYMKQGRWKEGISLLEGIDSENNERNYLFAQNKAICYLYLKDISNSVASLHEMNRYSLINIENLFSHFTGIERENYWTEISKERVFVNNLIAYHSNDDNAIRTAYDNAIFCKNLLVNSTRIMDRYIAQSSDQNLKQLYKKYNVLKSELAYKSANSVVRDSLAREIIDVERSILNSAGSLGQWLVEDSKTWKDVQESLNEHDIAIEFCYTPHMDTFSKVEPFYGAFVLRKGYDSPILVSLENVDVVEDVFDNDNPDELFVNDLYSDDKKLKLFNMLWHKLTPYLNDVKTVYYSPTGQLSNVNFDVLLGEDGVMLGERYSMNRVSSTANIGELKAKESSKFQSCVLYGNIKYDESQSDMADASSTYETFSGTEVHSGLALRSENERGKWGPIPSTKKEISNIGTLLSKKRVKVTTYEERAGNEESFKSLSGKSPEILHLATHGFVIDTPQRAKGNKFVASTSVYSQKDSYMMWAGLMLAGGNNIWQGNFNLTNVEDGILTADEISRLDLSGTKLAVLSACETARGKIEPVDGVFGLQRAFKMAGVGTIVMSLWKVQDDATSMLMTQFYTYLTSGIEKHQALWKAMMDVKEKYKDPYYWAGFIMLD
jgi:CHAT domain-containing protein